MFARGLAFSGVGVACLAVCVLASRAADKPVAVDEADRWALLIGVDEYAECAKLKYCGADMEALRDRLVKSGFRDSHIILMRNHAKEAKYEPSKVNVERQLDLLLNGLEKNSVVVIGFSGHGVKANRRSYLCTTEARLDEPDETMLAIDKVYERLQRCPAAFKLMMVDACRNDPRLPGSKALPGQDVVEGFAKGLQRPPRGIAVLTSCQDGETSMEDPDFNHGVFMHFLLDGLAGKADRDRDGTVTLQEAFRYAGSETKAHVARKFNGSQVPVLRAEEISIDSLDFALASLIGTPSTPSSPTPPGDRPPGIAGQVRTNSIGMKLVTIPEGKFLMGSPTDEQERSTDEQQHPVRITRPFEMGVYEVTRGQFGRFVETASYRTDAEKDGKGGWGWNETAARFEQDPKYTWRNPGFDQTDEHPVVNVSWNDAVAFCEWLSKQEGRQYRLPTEAQWEYACRAGTKGRFSSGDDPESLTTVGNVADGTMKAKYSRRTGTISARDGYVYTAPIGQFRPNGFGPYDMHGNATEWCADWYGEDYYGKSPADDPSGPSAGSFRVIRGGGWDYDAFYCRSAYRNYSGPTSRRYYIGFRVVGAP